MLLLKRDWGDEDDGGDGGDGDDEVEFQSLRPKA